MSASVMAAPLAGLPLGSVGMAAGAALRYALRGMPDQTTVWLLAGLAILLSVGLLALAVTDSSPRADRASLAAIFATALPAFAAAGLKANRWVLLAMIPGGGFLGMFMWFLLGPFSH